MKKRSIVILSFILIFALMAMPVYAKKGPAPDPRVQDSVEPSVTPATDYVTDLIACQDLDVGDLYINAGINENSYEVRYEITEPGWYLKEIHFEAINDGDENYIYSNGGLIPGQFTEKVYFDLPTVDEMTGVVIGGIREYSFLYISGAEVTDFAAHAVVCQAEITEEVRNEITGTRIEEGYIESNDDIAGATLVKEPFGYPNEPDDPNYVSVWETAFNASPEFVTKVLASGADFIWGYEYSTRDNGDTPNPISNYWSVYGDVFKVDVPVLVPDDASNISASLYIVADNGYIAKTGDDIISYAGFNPATYAALTPETETATETEALLLEVYATLRPSDTLTGAAFFVDSVVPSSAWKSMIAVENPFTLTTGLNTVNIATVNEHMAGGTYANNPAGVIFFIEYSWEVPVWEDVTHYFISFDRCETVWGDGDPVNEGKGGDWSMTIPNTVPAYFMTASLIPAFMMFPGSQYDTANTHSYADAMGLAKLHENDMIIETSGLIPGKVYTVYFDANGVTEGVVSTAGPWVSKGTFVADSEGKGLWNYTLALSPGDYSYSIFINDGFTMLISYNLDFHIN